MTFKVKRNTQFSKIMKKWAETQGQDVNAIRFMFDGEPPAVPRPRAGAPGRGASPPPPAGPGRGRRCGEAAGGDPVPLARWSAGQAVNGTDTPDSLEMDEGDQIDAVLYQVGGF